MTGMKKQLIDKFRLMLAANSKYYDMFDDLNYLLYSIKDAPFNLIEIEKKYLPYVENNLSDGAKEFVKDTKSVLDVFEKSKYYDLPKEVVNNIVQNVYFSEVMEKLDRFLLHCSQREKIEEVITYLENLKENEYLEIEKIKMILINDLKFDCRVKSDIFLLMPKYNIFVSKNIENMYDKEMLEIDIISNEELIDIFKEYGYNFLLVSEKMREYAKIYGDLDNIRYMFEFFKDNNVKFSENDEKYLYILFKSDEVCINNLKSICDDYGFELNSLLNRTPSVFWDSIKRDKVNRKPGPPRPGGDEVSLSGSNGDFKKNVELIKSLGYPVKESYDKCSSVFVCSYRKLKGNVDDLIRYGIDPNNFSKIIKLTGLTSSNILNTIDRFIELGELDYLFDNTSRLALDCNHVIFHRLYKVKKHNMENPTNPIDYKNISKTGSISYKSFITSYHDTTLKINNDNKNLVNNFVEPCVLFDEDKEKVIRALDEGKNDDKDPLEMSDIKFLEENYKVNDLVYSVCGFTFSRLKVLRLYSSLENVDIDLDDLLFYCLTYNSMLTKEDVEVIKNEINLKRKGDLLL
ncbi:MAG: hypothetical protein IJB83_02805 [Bacilli bacterium]|nr:hypothetical protein [Bacilli bacterium]